MENSHRPSVTTPKSNSRKSGSFSPVQLADSPVCRSPQSGNLTGNPRIVRDNAAELFNIVQDWNLHQLNGVSVVTDIANLKLFNLNETGVNDDTRDYPPGIYTLLESLNEICQKMKNVVDSMDRISKEMHAITKLESLRQKHSTPLFLTWMPEKFGETVDLIHDSYSKELKVKYYIKENIAHCFNKTEILFHSATWLHQPYVDDSLNLRLESMLKETGHR